MEDRLKYRMYGLVPYNISPIQQGIQYGHAVVEYMRENYTHGDESPCNTWADEDKTFIILNGGTTNYGGLDRNNVGTLNQHLRTLITMGIRVAEFKEPDLGNQLTAFVFLVDERVYDYEKYPDKGTGGTRPGTLMYVLPETEESYIERLGGEQNVKLREFLRKFRLA